MPSYRIVAIIKQTSLGFLSQILTNPEKIKKLKNMYMYSPK